MKILQKLRKEIVPLSSKQNLILLVIIACVFQFVLFYAPALADEAVNRAKTQVTNSQTQIINTQDQVNNSQTQVDDQEILIINDSVSKSPVMDQEAAKVIRLPIADSIPGADAVNTGSSTSSESAIKILRTSTHVITAYNSEAAQTDSSPCITANGFNVCQHGEEDTIAANFLKFGTKVQIPELFGDRLFVVRDRMNKRYPDRVDVWMKEKYDAIQFGVKVAKIQVVEIE